MTERQKMLTSMRVLLTFGMREEARKLWRAWKASTEVVYAPVDAEREHREGMAF